MIIVGVDGSSTARTAVEWAADDAVRMRLPLRLVHAVDRLPYEISRYPARSSTTLCSARRHGYCVRPPTSPASVSRAST